MDDPLKRLEKVTEELAGEDILSDPHISAAIIETLPDGLIVVDEDGKIMLANRQIELMFKYPRSELAKRSIHMLLPPELSEKHASHLANYFANPVARPMGAAKTFPGRDRNGKTIYVTISLGPVVSLFGVLALAVIRRSAPPVRNSADAEAAIK